MEYVQFGDGKKTQNQFSLGPGLKNDEVVLVRKAIIYFIHYHIYYAHLLL